MAVSCQWRAIRQDHDIPLSISTRRTVMIIVIMISSIATFAMECFTSVPVQVPALNLSATVVSHEELLSPSDPLYLVETTVATSLLEGKNRLTDKQTFLEFSSRFTS